MYAGALGIGGGLIQLKPEGPNGVAAEQVYFSRGLPNGFGGAILVDDHLYGTDMSGQSLVAAEFATGKVKWRHESVGRGSIAYADGHLYVHGNDGDVALVEAVPEGYREKGRFTPPNPPRKQGSGFTGEKAWAYPVIADGRLYLRDLGTVWAYDIGRPQSTKPD